MSGGSDKKRKKKEEEPVAGPTYSQPAFMPGMDSMLAQQLSAGGYGDPSSLMAAFAPVFTPMQMPDYRPGATPAPTTPSTGNNNGGGGSTRERLFRDLDEFRTRFKRAR